mmetsp:Transcript_11440/g.19337  ORF Transcript_11440/g.19337 Transcript_11440/m.19337 type:complete len:205 (+) Transcript_11440:777-1391(+)
MALEGHLILLLAGDAELLNHVLRGDSHGHEALGGLLVLEDLVGEGFGVDHVVHVEEGHRLDAATDSNIDLPRGNLGGHGGHSLQPGGAEPVHGVEGGGVGNAGHELRHSGGGLATTGLEHVADGDLLDELGVKVVGLLEHVLEDGGEHDLGGRVLLGALLGPCHGGTGSADDDDVVVALGSDAPRVVRSGRVVSRKLRIQDSNS